jgi:hypothetical protein
MRVGMSLLAGIPIGGYVKLESFRRSWKTFKQIFPLSIPQKNGTGDPVPFEFT